ncbi:hypothetical protein SAMN05428959_107107 [Duganella sp. CF517]|uniref:hypothetical protein n=1 Tax=Duganella sp. CF517 TaxID=1881038 RepID=UPI0008C1F87E|nr:hypothetical protein [Duganella sp. CF517]SEO38128.1 hypothetical protein SAMN05428959_107107 [Duganella sp. CF517]
MKLSYLGAIVALSAAALVAGCGGKAQYTVQGTINGLATPGLQLSNGGETISIPAGATTFAFPRQIGYGTSYAVTFAQQPEHMACNFDTINTGSAGQTVAISVAISCVRRAYTLGGQFTGLFPVSAAVGTTPAVLRTVTLLNGSAGGAVTLTSPTDATGAGDFAFSTNVADGQSYGVTIHPDTTLSSADITCTVKNGVGVMGESAVTNLLVECKPK